MSYLSESKCVLATNKFKLTSCLFLLFKVIVLHTVNRRYMYYIGNNGQ